MQSVPEPVSFEEAKRVLLARRTFVEKNALRYMNDLIEIGEEYQRLLQVHGHQQEPNIMKSGSKEHKTLASSIATSIDKLFIQGYRHECDSSDSSPSTTPTGSKRRRLDENGRASTLPFPATVTLEGTFPFVDDMETGDEDIEEMAATNALSQTALSIIQHRQQQVQKYQLLAASAQRKARLWKERNESSQKQLLEASLKEEFTDFSQHHTLLGKDLIERAHVFFQAHLVKATMPIIKAIHHHPQQQQTGHESWPPTTSSHDPMSVPPSLSSFDTSMVPSSALSGASYEATVVPAPLLPPEEDVDDEEPTNDRSDDQQQNEEKRRVFLAVIAAVCNVINHSFGPLPKLRTDSAWKDSRRIRRIRTLATPLTLALQLLISVAEEVTERKLATNTGERKYFLSTATS